MVRFLQRQEFALRRIVGSHHVMRHADGRQTVVSVHGNQDMMTGTLRGILRDIRMQPEEFEALWRGK